MCIPKLFFYRFIAETLEVDACEQNGELKNKI